MDIGPRQRNDQRFNFGLGVSTINAPLTLESLNLAHTRFDSGDLVHFPKSLKTLDNSNSTLEQAITVSEDLLTADPKLKMQHDASVEGLDRSENLETLTLTSKLKQRIQADPDFSHLDDRYVDGESTINVVET